MVDCKVENVMKWKSRNEMSRVDSKNAAVEEKTSYDISMRSITMKKILF